MTKRPLEEVLVVARAHGTSIAADWGGWSTGTLAKYRKERDGYDRGRGHPNAAEMALRAPRLLCKCRRCHEHYMGIATADEAAEAERRRIERAERNRKRREAADAEAVYWAARRAEMEARKAREKRNARLAALKRQAHALGWGHVFEEPTYEEAERVDVVVNQNQEEVEVDLWAQARCAPVDRSIFYPTFGGRDPGSTHRDLYEPAKRVCALCPIREECLDHALANGEVGGVWGGLDPIDRSHLPGRRYVEALERAPALPTDDDGELLTAVD